MRWTTLGVAACVMWGALPACKKETPGPAGAAPASSVVSPSIPPSAALATVTPRAVSITPQLHPSPARFAPNQTLSCLQLPATARHGLVVSDTGQLIVGESSDSAAVQRLRFVDLVGGVQVDLGTGPALRPAFLPDGAVIVARTQAGSKSATGSRAGSARLVRIELATGAVTELTPADHDVASFVVDGDQLYYAAARQLWTVKLGAGEPRAIGNEVINVFLKLGNQPSFLIESATGNALHTARLTPGHAEVAIAAMPERVGMTSAGVALQTDPHDLFVLPPDGGSAVKMAAFQPGDRLATSGAEAFVVREAAREHKPTNELIDIAGGSWKPMFTLEGAAFAEGVRLPDGRMVLLLAHDTSTPFGYGPGDETDICILPKDAGPVVRPDTRTIPLRFAEPMPAILELAREAGLVEPSLVATMNGAVLGFASRGQGPASLAALRAQGLQVQRGVAALVHEPRVGVRIDYGETRRFSAVTWDAPRGRLVGAAGISNLASVAEPADFDVALVKSDVKITPHPGGERGRARCQGTVTNTSSSPLALVAECEPVGIGWGYGVAGPCARCRTPVSPSPLPAGATGTFDAEGSEGPSGARPRFSVATDGRYEVVQTLMPSQHERAVACYDLVAAAALGPNLRLGSRGMGLSGIGHSNNSQESCTGDIVFAAPEGFETWESGRRAALAKELQRVVDTVLVRHRGVTLPKILVAAAERSEAWELRAGAWIKPAP